MRTFLWTLASVALGIALATVDVGGRTPWQHLQRAWRQHVAASSVDALKDRAKDAWDDARDRLTRSRTPHEHHSTDDRAALNRLIARRATQAR